MALPIAVAAALLALSACREAELITQTTWQLERFNGRHVAETTTLRIPDAGQLEGHAPCNSYSGRWVGVEEDFRTEGIISTRMACPQLAAEQAYLSALQRVNSAEVSPQSLLLTGPGVRLRFRPLPPAG